MLDFVLAQVFLMSLYSPWMLESVLVQGRLDTSRFRLFPFSRPPSGGLVEDGEMRRLGRSHHRMFFLLFNKSSAPAV